MSRAGAVARRAELEAEANPHAQLPFLEITHSGLTRPIRVVSDVFDYVWRGHTWLGLPFEIDLLTDGDAPPEARVRVQNTDRRIGEALRTMPDRAQLALSLLSSADFDLSVNPRVEVGTAAVIYGYAHFELVDVDADATQLVGRIFLRDLAQEIYGFAATEARAPGLFA
ncbi:MAG: DUF1833 domain-containing protein [Rhodobacteraceae bacterium]|jgi:hypothetical protein|nr:DUF1833 domain-containing protein [Paracoccaceae bacterium]